MKQPFLMVDTDTLNVVYEKGHSKHVSNTAKILFLGQKTLSFFLGYILLKSPEC